MGPLAFNINTLGGFTVRLRAAFAVVSAASAALIVPAVTGTAPSAAADSGLSIGDGILYDGCVSHPIGYDSSYPGADSWEIDGTVYSPGGDESGGFYDYGDG